MNIKRLTAIAPDICFVAGAAALVYGAHQVYPPAAWLLGGLFSMAAGMYLTRLERKEPS